MMNLFIESTNIFSKKPFPSRISNIFQIQTLYIYHLWQNKNQV